MRCPAFMNQMPHCDGSKRKPIFNISTIRSVLRGILCLWPKPDRCLKHEWQSMESPSMSIMKFWDLIRHWNTLMPRWLIGMQHAKLMKEGRSYFERMCGHWIQVNSDRATPIPFMLRVWNCLCLRISLFRILLTSQPLTETILYRLMIFWRFINEFWAMSIRLKVVNFVERRCMSVAIFPPVQMICPF